MLFGRVVGICAFFPFLGNPLLTYFRFLFGTVRPFALWFYTYTSSISTNYIYFFRTERGSASYVNGCITSGGVLRAVKRHSISDSGHWYFISPAYFCEDVYPLHLFCRPTMRLHYNVLCFARLQLLCPDSQTSRKVVVPFSEHWFVLYVKLTNIHRLISRAISEKVCCLLRVTTKSSISPPFEDR